MGGQPGASGPGGGGAATGPDGCGFAAARIWKLTPQQFGRAVAHLLPGVEDAGDRIAASVVAGAGFSNDAGQLTLTGPHLNAVLDAAWSLAADAAAAPDKLMPCLTQAPATPACLAETAAVLGARAYRRDLSREERERLTGFLTRQSAVDRSTGLRQFLMYLIASPEFLFRTELGPEGASGATVALTGFERASALSFWLTDGPPDPQLMEAARAGTLDRPEGIATHVRRLVAGPNSAGGWLRFLREHFRTENAAGARKDPMAYPIWTGELGQALAAESEAFLRQAMWIEGGRLATLLEADFTMSNQQLATFYGLPDPGPGAGLVKVAVRPGERAGLLTQAGLQAALASDTDTSPVMRGLYVRETVLCGHVPSPPPNISNVPPQPDGKRTQRERLASHSGDPSCAGCHALMDPLGLALRALRSGRAVPEDRGWQGHRRQRNRDAGRARAAVQRCRGAGEAAGGGQGYAGLLCRPGVPVRPRPRPSDRGIGRPGGPAHRPLRHGSSDPALPELERQRPRTGGGHRHRRQLLHSPEPGPLTKEQHT